MKRRVRVSGLAAALCLSLVAVPQAAFAATGDDLPFATAVFRATHNSYSGNIAGSRGSLTQQLDAGVRFVELDVWSGDYASAGDFRIGHGSPGDQVDHAGNPAGDQLRPWLGTVASWSGGHPSAAPITLMLDLKDDVSSRSSAATGNLGALNEEIQDVLGARLVRPAGPLPAIGSLRGKVLSLLSGNATARTAYKRDTGSNPAVAINASGQVVEVHDNGSGALFYWTGRYGADGQLTWLRHGRYDTGKTPAVALNPAGALLEVHQAPSGANLWSRTGQLGATGEITWSVPVKYDTGALPSIAFTDAAGTAFREIHKSQGSAQEWEWTGTFSNGTAGWGGHGKTPDARLPTTSAAAGERTVSVTGGTLTATTDRAAATRIRYPQIAYVEYQPGDNAELKDGALFWAAAATNKAFIVAARQAGVSARAWDFDSASLATEPPASYPATNTPYASWYQELLDRPDAVS
jgi:hypothetical protein